MNGKANNSGLIAIIIPVYNVSRYLKRCLSSILAQSYDDFEILLVDDGSLDESSEICDSLLMKDSRIHVFHQPNGGVSTARNLGLEKAAGEFVTFVDGDDYIHPCFLETLYHALEQTGSQVSMIKSIKVYEYQEPQTLPIPSPRILSQDETIKYMFLNSKIDVYFLALWNKMYTRKVIEGLQFKDIVSEDGEYNLRAYLRMDKLAYVDCPLYYYTQRRASLTHQGYVSIRFVDEIQPYHLYLDFLLKEKPKYKAYCLEKLMKRLLNIQHHSRKTPFDTYAKSSIELAKDKYLNEFKHHPLIPRKKRYVLLFFIKFPAFYSLFLWMMEKRQWLLNHF